MQKNATVDQMNEVICKFMGGYRKVRTINIYKGPDEIEWETGKYLKYHKDWNWLMPVVEKIETIIPFKIAIFHRGCDIYPTQDILNWNKIEVYNIEKK